MTLNRAIGNCFLPSYGSRSPRKLTISDTTCILYFPPDNFTHIYDIGCFFYQNVNNLIWRPVRGWPPNNICFGLFRLMLPEVPEPHDIWMMAIFWIVLLSQTEIGWNILGKSPSRSDLLQLYPHVLTSSPTVRILSINGFKMANISIINNSPMSWLQIGPNKTIFNEKRVQACASLLKNTVKVSGVGR